MIPYLDCHAAQERLEAFVDGELPVDDQVSVEAHLRWCRVCAARVEDMQTIRTALRMTSCAIRSEDEADESLASVQSDVVARIGAEREQSAWAQLHFMCSDMRFFWPAVGASCALVACLFVAATMFSATSDERPDSLAGMISVLANPGSDANPMRLDGAMAAPPRAINGGALDALSSDDAVFALSAVVTREGRLANYELLFAEHASVRRHDTAVQNGDVSSVVNAVKQSRFEPAQSTGGAPVAVNMVWVLARTTVKASARASIEPPQVPAARVAPVPHPADTAPKPESPSTSSTVASPSTA